MPRVWSNFEMQSLLALIAKGVHIYGSGKKKDNPQELQKNAYVDFATTLNESLHGNDYSQDISKKEITRKLDETLVHFKHIVGKGGLLERNRGGRITKSLTMAFQRKHGQGYDGGLSEWNNGRREKVMGRYRREHGLPPLEADAGQTANSNDGLTPAARTYKKPGTCRWRSQRMQNPEQLGGESSDSGGIARLAPSLASPTAFRDSYTTLPSKLRTSDKYGWANPEALAPRPDVHRPAGDRFAEITRSHVAPGAEARPVPSAYDPRPCSARGPKSTCGSNDSGYRSADTPLRAFDPLTRTIGSGLRRAAEDVDMTSGELEKGEELEALSHKF